MGLVFQTVLFGVINIVVLMLVLSVNNIAIAEFDENKVSITENITGISSDEIDMIPDFRVTEGQLKDVLIPDWFIFWYSFIMVTWGSFIVIGWIRGQD